MPDENWDCDCVGPQNGEPLCPCKMKKVEGDIEPKSAVDDIELAELDLKVK